MEQINKTNIRKLQTYWITNGKKKEQNKTTVVELVKATWCQYSGDQAENTVDDDQKDYNNIKEDIMTDALASGVLLQINYLNWDLADIDQLFT